MKRALSLITVVALAATVLMGTSEASKLGAAVHRAASVHRVAISGPLPASSIVATANAAQPDTLQGDAWLTPQVGYYGPGYVWANTAYGSLGVSLPSGNPAVQNGVMNGTMVLAGGQTASVLTPETGGFQLAQVITQGAPTTYVYPMNLPPGYSLTQPNPYAQNIIAITSDPADATQANTLGYISPAWAVDAAGVSVPSRYYVWGNTLIQVTSPSASTVFPVVADPSVTVGWVIYAHFFHNDLAGFVWRAVAGAMIGAIGYVCIYTGWFAYFCGLFITGLIVWNDYNMTYCYKRAWNSGILYEFNWWPQFSFNSWQCVGDNWPN